ncbi:DedA family protein [Kitasatospora sp. McL0602]|uniref:DedA family protein n=1 Tax=Kitasatospora sp. McL0602 TaxID=3439530 RepID=UPI003F8BB5CE
MNSLTQWLAGLSGPLVYAVVTALVFVEDGFLVGLVLPGESAVVVGGVIAREGAVSVYWLSALVVLAAIAGDFVGYEIGRRSGPLITRSRFLRRRTDQVEAAQDLLRRRGPAAVFFGRFIAFARTLVPGLAGMARMPYRRFVRYNALGALLWGVGFTLLGYYLGDAYVRIEQAWGPYIAVGLLGILLVGLLGRRALRRLGRRHAAHAAQADDARPEEREARSDAHTESGP